MRWPWSGPRTATAALVAANLVPLVGVAWFDWNLHTLLVGYWLESGAIGATYAAKIRRAGGEDDPEELPSLSINSRSVASFVGKPNRQIATVFLGQYGLFWVGHGLFVLTLPSKVPAVEPAPADIVAAASVALVTYHVASYRLTYLGEREYEGVGPVRLMVEPYRRVFVLHVTVVFGGATIGLLDSPTGTVAVLVLAKTVFDLRGHWRHRRGEERGSSPTSA